ncbi:hypothetical protein GCK72_026237 [Caenorhabditis remanei]|uniref:Uncharacterized protein n=1 Tax=Caenorhabditis remanei TaxID=31234 RepID=A0A6A5G434_CAERE|nr:hypothetical protein GCK72_026237 [Caenorhabditis remanei]KAF1749768.1 hypothetical protein GCK72_026237 [Caenorhabditis remanei]
MLISRDYLEFQEYSTQNGQKERSVLCLEVLAAANQNKDFQPKATKFQKISVMRGRPINTCDIRGCNGLPYPEKLTRGTKAAMETSERPIYVEVERATCESERITLALKPMSSRLAVFDTVKNLAEEQGTIVYPQLPSVPVRHGFST